MRPIAPVALAVLAFALALPSSAAGPSAGVDLSGIDKAVAPGDDFYGYANGAWQKRTVIAPDHSAESTDRMLVDLTEQRTADLVREIAASNPPAGSEARKIADYYAAFVDQAGIEKQGVAPLRPGLAAIAAIRALPELSRALGASMRADTDPFNNTEFHTENLFGLFVTQGLTTPDTTVPYLMQGGLGMPDRDYYLSPMPQMAKYRADYLAYVSDMLRLAGIGDPEAKAQRIVALETKIATAQVDIVASQDSRQARNWSAADFAAKAPGIDWAAFWSAAELPHQQRFIAWQPMAITRLSALVASQPLEVWKDWLAFHLINQYTAVLPQALDRRAFAFNGKELDGTPEQRVRWKRAIASVNDELGDAVGQRYAQRYFSPQAKAELQNMVANIVAALDRRLAALSWMAPATKAEARAKLKATYVGVGYPESWRDYSGLEIRPDDAFGNLQRARRAEYRHQIGKIGKPVDKREWWMTPQTVNAVNLPVQVALNFPAAYLQPPYFDPKQDAAANYGAVGATMGHEISHTFDNTGADFDAKGALRNWWTPSDFAHFKASGAALIKQYDAYEPLPGVHVNGAQTLGENIADLAGLEAALDAYHASLHGKPAPVIEGLTGDQRFFLAFGQSWREKRREASLRQRILTDVHAPAEQRAQTVRNLDAWYPAFKVVPGQKLYLAPAQRVRVY
ncbi:MAG: M13 family metallopeptidase [Sphingomonadaceae bacterium]|nr:M13 family metallopeptidase [Sphingomonadaceae bacterium]